MKRTPGPTVRSRRGKEPKLGRRPKGSTDAREAMLDAALRVIAANGYDRATLRLIAHEARVDPALVYHYFDDKEALFAAAIASKLQPPPRSEVPARETVAQTAERLVSTFFTRWGSDPLATPLAALLRAAVSDPSAATLLRRLFEKDLVEHVAKRFGRKDADLRVALVASQLLGLGLVRYVLGLEALAKLSIAQLARLAAPAVARALAVSRPRS